MEKINWLRTSYVVDKPSFKIDGVMHYCDTHRVWLEDLFQHMKDADEIAVRRQQKVYYYDIGKQIQATWCRPDPSNHMMNLNGGYWSGPKTAQVPIRYCAGPRVFNRILFVT